MIVVVDPGPRYDPLIRLLGRYLCHPAEETRTSNAFRARMHHLEGGLQSA